MGLAWQINYVLVGFALWEEDLARGWSTKWAKVWQPTETSHIWLLVTHSSSGVQLQVIVNVR